MEIPWKQPKKVDVLEREMDILADLLNNEDVDSPEYHKHLERWLELDERRMEHQELQVQRRVKPDTWVLAGKTLLIALLTLNYEKFDILTSRVSQLWLRDRDS